ncbi:MAG: hypothetical protein CM1200mP25_2720 [Acidobacteriota bacterium]|nr:MAG: hypothetical protein CM1200mP25_2720 [Acidobacteriota bacterium]
MGAPWPVATASDDVPDPSAPFDLPQRSNSIGPGSQYKWERRPDDSSWSGKAVIALFTQPRAGVSHAAPAADHCTDPQALL